MDAGFLIQWLAKDDIVRLHSEGKWRQILKYFEDGYSDESLLWFRPTEQVLKTLKMKLNLIDIKKIVSVGCGTGLLEWLIHCYTGLDVVGLEVDQLWWSSKYSPPKFWNRIQIIDSSNIPPIDSDSVLLFCYFNNRSAFYEYLKSFTGRYLILMGPLSCRHCDPLPFHFQQSDQWKIILEVPNQSGDVLVMYEKNSMI